MKKNLFSIVLILFFAIMTACSNSDANNEDTNKAADPESNEVERTDLILATTTSTQDSGLLDELIPIFEEENPFNVKTVAVGTGQALEMGVKGEADTLLTHAPASEQELVDNGDVENYQQVMYNDFVVAGPKADPAEVKGLSTNEAFSKIFESQSVFVSRGDDSGTHKKELQLWEGADLTPSENENYLETGQGMGNSLQVAAEKEGYILTDRATYLAQKDTLGEFEILVEGDESLLNIYHVMEVNAEKNDMINTEGAKAFVEFMVAEDTKKIISEFGVEEYGEPLFFLFD
ncbi:substrate-binding domain-containing protein [Mesobacillus maritimus]|uniref:substrate-binding domain-containing protein n=1 Tax=Mesobacillus maritimus TaxID=1643336 RepID=UPI00203E3300|nr:substrate-binding domain-containing protein [Mesobacillus maritimus]MCM3585095.1 substrate-binding domain-containing protein [Mesobacillus maritimus]MCM3670317.1 substrate-binding domain-containing protein [Mesobacillus maritimus]